MKPTSLTSSAKRSKKYRSIQKSLSERRRRNADAQRKSRKKGSLSNQNSLSLLKDQQVFEMEQALGDVGRYDVHHDGNGNKNFRFQLDQCPHEENLLALIDIFQWRKPSSSQHGICDEISRVQSQIEADLRASEDYLKPRTKVLCFCCGQKVASAFIDCLSERETEKINILLEGKVYTCGDTHCLSQKSNLVGSRTLKGPVFCCKRCLRDLRCNRTPIGARCNGWNFADETPDVLSRLSKHERLLISLRLPCIHTWRLQGGFGQHASKGIPVSFANPVANLAKTLPWRPTAVFAPLLENGVKVNIRVLLIQCALEWLQNHNGFDSNIEIDQAALREVKGVEEGQSISEISSDFSVVDRILSNEEKKEAEIREAQCGTQGPLDGEALCYLESSAMQGIEDLGDISKCRELIQHMLRPFTYRRNDMIPSYDAAKNLETYFPVLFPYGRGGPETLRRTVTLAFWCKQALSVHCSPFKTDLDFIFFVNAVLRRKRLSGLALNAPIRDRTSQALKEIRELLDGKESASTVNKKIDHLIRSGAVNASFERLRGSAAFWANLRSTSWAYLVRFGPCQLFLTMSVADVIDPFVFMEIDDKMSYEDARQLLTLQRAQLLAENPVAATNIFHRMVECLLNHFLFGRTRPFQGIIAYLGRVEQQERKSPHLHLLLWLSSQTPARTGNKFNDGIAIAKFIECFCTAVIPPEELISVDDLLLPNQQIPVSATKRSKLQTNQVLKMNGQERHHDLSRPCDPFAFSDSKEKRNVLGKQMIAAQSHVCSNYCRPNGEPCRFMFPFESQVRGSVGKRWKKSGDIRTLAFCPRTDPWLNITHPMLTAMFRANTDVTVITGNSITECAYVCSYAFKADKTPMFDTSVLNKLRCINEQEEDHSDRKLLATIARGTESVRVVGGQEACDNLLGNPLVFLSAKVLNVRTSFLLDTAGALSEHQMRKREQDRERYPTHCNILGDLYPDVNVAVPQSKEVIITERNQSGYLKGADQFMQTYMLRPFVLEDLSASEFFESYVVCRSTARERSKARDMLLFESNESESLPKVLRETSLKFRSCTTKSLLIVRRRKRPQGKPQITHFLNVLTRGEADEDNPNFAAAALMLYVPFRTPESLLNQRTLTDPLREVLQAPGKYPKVESYVLRSHDLRSKSCTDGNSSNTMSKEFDQSLLDEEESSNKLPSSGLDELNELPGLNMDLDDESIDLLNGLPPVIVKDGKKDPSKISKGWSGAYITDPEIKIQSNEFLKYLKECKEIGVQRANEKHYEESLKVSKGNITEENSHRSFDSQGFEEDWTKQLKEQIFRSCRNEQQKSWLKGIFSYLQIYYTCLISHVGTSKDEDMSFLYNLKKICRKNRIMLTNAPGGCGKSWLIQKLKLFVSKSIRCGAHPPLGEEDENDVCDDRNEQIENNEEPIGRFGRVAIFAPSGVAADNAGGFTFHDGLRTYPITASTIIEDLSLKKISQLAKDFKQVVCIVIDEFSMCNIYYLEYLDRIQRIIRPGFGNRKFGGIPVIMTGDAFQLPVVRGYGIFSHPQKVPSFLRSIFKHCTENVFFFELFQSVRQEKDSDFSSTLERVRLAKATNEDVDILNSRSFSDLTVLAKESNEWTYAPILTAKNVTAEALNDAAIARNGEALGTSHVYSVPIISRAVKSEVRKKKYDLHFKTTVERKRKRSLKVNLSGFKPLPRLILYPGIPLMIRTNIFTGLGLSNGSVGRLMAIIRRTETRMLLHTARENLHSLIHRSMESTLRDPPYVPSLLLKLHQGYRGLMGATPCFENGIEEKEGSNTVLIEPVTNSGVRGLPVSIAHSFTTHKAQSLTLPRTIIDPRDTFCMGALYVALSRSPSLDRIALILKISKQQINKYREQVVAVEKKIHKIKKNALDISIFVEGIERNAQSKQGIRESLYEI